MNLKRPLLFTGLGAAALLALKQCSAPTVKPQPQASPELSATGGDIKKKLRALSRLMNDEELDEVEAQNELAHELKDCIQKASGELAADHVECKEKGDKYLSLNCTAFDVDGVVLQTGAVYMGPMTYARYGDEGFVDEELVGTYMGQFSNMDGRVTVLGRPDEEAPEDQVNVERLAADLPEKCEQVRARLAESDPLLGEYQFLVEVLKDNLEAEGVKAESDIHTDHFLDRDVASASVVGTTDNGTEFICGILPNVFRTRKNDWDDDLVCTVNYPPSEAAGYFLTQNSQIFDANGILENPDEAMGIILPSQ